MMKSVVAMLLFSASINAFAAEGVCKATDGHKKYSLFVNEMLSGSGSSNGAFLEAKWSESSYTLSCECTSSFHHEHITWKATTDLAPFTDLPFYYRVNDFLAVRTDVNIQGEEWEHYVPFDGAIDSAPLPGNCQGIHETSGTTGSVALYLRKPVSGQIHIPRTRLYKLFATTHESSGAPNEGFGNVPVSELWLEGEITGPASCVINDGNIINVDMHSINRNALTRRGVKPDRYIDEVVKISLKCTNVNQAVQVKLKLSAKTVGADLPAIQTSNPDVGIMLEHNKSQIVPQRTEIPVPVNNQYGEVELQAYPVNARGKMPSSGLFEATAGLDLIYK